MQSRIYTEAKDRFGEGDSGLVKYENKDFAIIGIFYSKE